MITSRERPNILSQDSFRIFGLATPPIDADLAQAGDFAASRLFLDRARRQYKPFRLDEAGWPLVIKLCHRLEGLPLGIELASTLIGELTLPDLVDSLANDIDLLETALYDVAPHHRSIRAVFEQSWQRLSDGERQSLARLSVMRGTFSAAGARAVAQTTPLLLRRLRHQSLLRSTTPGFYNIHELIRQFSAEKRRSEHDLDQRSKQAHAEWYLQLVGRYRQAVLKEPVQQVQKRILQELGNVRAAWRWAGEQGLIALLAPSIDGLADYYYDATNPHAGAQQLAMMRELVAKVRPNPSAPVQRLIAHLMTREASILSNHGDPDRAIALLQTALASITKQDAPRLTGMALYNLGSLMLHVGDSQSAFDHFSQGRKLAELSGDRALTAMCIRDLGNMHRQRGEFQPFLDYLHQARAIYVELGDRAAEHNVLAWLGAYTAEMGDYHEGKRWLDKAWAQQAEVGTLYTEASILGALGRCDELFGEYESAIEQQQLAVQKLRKLNALWRLCFALIQLASALANAGRFDESAHHLSEAEMLATEKKFVELAALVHTVSSYALFAQGRITEAEPVMRDAIEVWRTIGRGVSLAELRILLARLLLMNGRLEGARTLLEQVSAFCDFRPIHGAWHREKMLDNLSYVAKMLR